MAASLKSEIKVIAKHSSVYGLANILNRAFSFLLLPLYTSYLSPADYGLLEILYFVSTIVALAMSMGVNQAMTRFYFDKEDREYRNSVISTTFLSLGSLSVITSLVLVLFSDYVSLRLFDTIDYSSHCTVLFLSMGINFLVDISFGYFRVEQMSVRLTIFSLAKLLLTIALNILFLVVFEMGVIGILLGTLIANSTMGVFMISNILKRTRLRYSWPLAIDMVKFGLPMIPSSVASYLMIASDRWFVKEFVSLAETGLYSLGYKFGTLVSDFVTSAFIQIWFPRRFEFFDKEDSERIFARIFTYFVGFVTFGALGISMFSREVLVLMTNERYWDAHKIIPLIALAHIFHALYYHFNIGISYFKKTSYFSYINITTALINLGLNFWLIRSYGMWGAAYSTLATYIARATLVYYFSNRLFPIVFERMRVFKILVAAAIVYTISYFVDTDSIWLDIGIKTVVLTGYPLIMFAFKTFTDDEMRELKRMIGKYWSKLTRKKAAPGAKRDS